MLERLGRQRSATAASGIYLGAFGLLENVKPGTPAAFAQEVAPVFAGEFDRRTACLPLVNTRHLLQMGQVLDKVLANSFVYLGDRPSNDCRLDFAKRKVVMQAQRPAGNQGFVHGPSPEHALRLRFCGQAGKAVSRRAATMSARSPSVWIRRE